MKNLQASRKFITEEQINHEILRILSEENLSESRVKQIFNIPLRYRLAYVRSLGFLRTHISKALSAKMKCYECVGFEEVRNRIGDCTARLCPLWIHRPFQDRKAEEQDCEE